MFKFRKSANTGRDADSVETIRRRAQYRLVGTAILVGVAIVGFPLLFDTEPRPLEVDLPIAIPSKDQVQPLVVPSTTSAAAVAKAPVPVPVPQQTAQAKPLSPAETPTRDDAQQALKAQARDAAQAQEAANAAAQQAAQALAAKQAEAARAQAILNGSNAKTDYPDDGKRRVIQVGSFNDQGRAREVRMRLERAGITTYTQVVNSGGARFIRVRVGPFDDAKELQRYIDKVESLKLEARVLTF